MKKLEKDVNKIYASLKAVDAIKLLTGDGAWNIYIPEALKSNYRLRVSDGPAGLRKVEDDGKTLPSISFPYASSVAASFDKDLSYNIGKKYATIAKANGVDVVLGPAMNIKRTPLCGRNFEYFSEDPVLSGKLSASMVKGIEENGALACIKHYLGNNTENGRYTSSSNIDQKALNEIYLRNFKIAITESKPSFIMTSYNRVNHQYVSENKELLDLPRNEWGFDGIYLSDWGAISNRKASILSGLDIEMPESDSYKRIFSKNPDPALKDAVEQAEKRVLKTILEKGKINNKVPQVDMDELHNYASYASANSIILAKNEDDILPVKYNEKIAIIGGLSNNPFAIGGGSGEVTPYKMDKFTTELKKIVKDLTYAQGYDDDLNTNSCFLAEVKDALIDRDKVILFVGSKPFHEYEGADRADMKMKDSMSELINYIYKYNTNIILVVETGSPLEIPFIDKAKAVLVPYLGGEGMNKALSLSISGIISPSGRFPESWPKEFDDSPSISYTPTDLKDQYYTESIYVGYRYFDKADIKPLFSFGEGLSYSEFVIKSFSSKKGKDGVKFSATVENIGKQNASTPLLLYVSKGDADTYRPIKELVDFDKHFIAKGKKTKFSFYVPFNYLKSYDSDSKKMILENGEYKFMLGFTSSNLERTKVIDVKSKDAFFINERFAAKSYFNFSDNSFSISKFETIYREDLVDSNTKIGWDSLLSDFDQTTAGSKIKKELLKILESKLKNSPDYFRSYVETAPIRIINEAMPLYTYKDFNKIFDIANGVNTNYGDFQRIPVL